jgi:mannose/fructose/N-acetylgalactosamine-specific phosphotransferase system component IID
MKRNIHFLPTKPDLIDLIPVIEKAKEEQEEVQEIIDNASAFFENNLRPR